MDRETYVAALRFEREGYARYDRADRVAEVDDELRRLGEEVSDERPAKRGPGRPAKRPAGERD